MKERIDAAVRAIVYGSIAAAAGVAAFLFLAIAAFFWAQQHYDTIIACGALGGLFLLVALIALFALAMRSEHAPRLAAVAGAAVSIGFVLYHGSPFNVGVNNPEG